MYELLIRIETLYLEAAPGILFAIGAAAILVGLLFWLAGALFSPIIIGLMGAAFGATAGLIVSNLFNLNLLRAAVFGAAAFCLAAILFRNVIIIGLAVAVFALATGTAYSSFILSKLPPLHHRNPPSRPSSPSVGWILNSASLTSNRSPRPKPPSLTSSMPSSATLPTPSPPTSGISSWPSSPALSSASYSSGGSANSSSRCATASSEPSCSSSVQKASSWPPASRSAQPSKTAPSPPPSPTSSSPPPAQSSS